jgi:hypothetical protein
MGHRRKSSITSKTATDQEMRDQEVLRANRELAAYFRGRRTEREARKALKIIKAFVRDRERGDAKNRSPLPGIHLTKMPKRAPNGREESDDQRGKSRLKHQAISSNSVTATIEPATNPKPQRSPASGKGE